MSAVGYSEIFDKYADFFAQPQELLSSVMRQIDELHASNLVLCPLHLRQGDVDAGGRTNQFDFQCEVLVESQRFEQMQTASAHGDIGHLASSNPICGNNASIQTHILSHSPAVIQCFWL